MSIEIDRNATDEWKQYLKRVGDEALRQAVEAERQRCKMIVECEATKSYEIEDYGLAIRLHQCRDAIMAPASEPTPQPAEPEKRPGIHPGTPEYEKLREWANEPVQPAEPEMTIAKLLDKSRAGYPAWNSEDELEADLTRLVQAQSRRDGAVCDTLATGGCQEDGKCAACDASRAAYRECGRVIRESAGLDA